MLKEIRIERFDNLANLREQLCRLEPAYFARDSNDLRQAREGLIEALKMYRHSRFNLGRALRAYKTFFKADHTWVEAAKVIAAFIGKSERSIHRIIEDFERAEQLPAIVIDAMLDQNIDPAAGKHKAKIEELRKIPEPKTRKEADATVDAVVKREAAQKRKKPASVPAKDDFEVFKHRTLKLFVDRYRSPFPPEQRDAEVLHLLELIANTLRVPISELRQFARPTLVPKPVKQEVS
jgi:hypothetical protein